jgi:copper chaperone CopZ
MIYSPALFSASTRTLLMKKTVLMIPAAAMATCLLCACENKAEKQADLRESKTKPTFLFWCFRKEIVSSDYTIPEMSTPAAANYIKSRLTLPGIEGAEVDLGTHTLTVRYQSSTIRKMNIEEAIALAGFTVNDRPANPAAHIPEGIK